MARILVGNFKGKEGPSGPPNRLTIGSVTKGESAQANISGTEPNQVLNLVLPQGPEGSPGATEKINVDTDGTAVFFPSGLCICMKKISAGSVQCNLAYGGGFYGEKITGGNLPTAIESVLYAGVSCNNSSIICGKEGQGTTSKFPDVYPYCLKNYTANNIVFDFIVIGMR